MSLIIEVETEAHDVNQFIPRGLQSFKCGGLYNNDNNN